MPKKQLQNTQKASEYFAQVNEHLKDNFILYGQPGPEGITLLTPASYASLGLKREVDDLASAEAAKPIHLTKTVIAEYSKPDAKVKTQLAIVNEDGEYDTLVWTTTPENIQRALRSGVFASSGIINPLAKVISQLGEYKRQVFSRSVEDNYVIVHNQEKLDVVEVTQLCVEALEDLHCRINNYNDGDTPGGNLQSIINKLDQLQEQFDKIKKEQLKNSQLEPYATLDDGITRLENTLNNYKRNLQTLLEDKSRVLMRDDIEDILRTYGNPLRSPDLSLQHFLQAQLNAIMNNGVEANYAVSGLFQDGSNLQRYLATAQITAEKFSTTNVDYNNPSTPEHAFNFSAQANSDGLVTIDFSDYGFTPNSKLDIAKQAALIYRVDSNRALFSKKNQGPGLFGIRWNINPLAPANWLGNGIKDLVSTFADTLYIAGKAIVDGVQTARGIKTTPPQLPGSTSLLRKTDLNESKYAKLEVAQRILSDANPVTNIPYQSLIERGYTGLKNIGARYVVDPFISLSNFVVEELGRFRTAKKVYYDYTIGSRPADETAVTFLLQKRLSEMTANQEGNAIMQAALLESYNEFSEGHEISAQGLADSYYSLDDNRQISSYEELEKSFAVMKQSMPQAAVTPYTLTPDNPGDLVSWAVNDFTRGLTAVFSEKIYRQHPIAGLAFTIAASTAAPMLVPALAHSVILGAINQHISVPLAELVLGKTTGMMPAFSTAILQGQLAYLGTDAFNGCDSLLRNGLQTTLENPVIAGILGTAAVGFGYALAYKLDIPFLSDAIAEETSKAAFPYFQLGIAGAKVAAILIEGTMNLHGTHHESNHDLINEAINKMHGQIEEAVRNTYMQTHETANKEEIKKQTAEYCDALKKALKEPALAAQISQMSQTIAALIGKPKPANFMGIPAIVNNEKSQNQILHFLQRRVKRQQLAMLDPTVLSERDKYVFMNYVEQTYQNDPQYIASVRNRFDDVGRKPGPLGQTLNIILAYPSILIRSAIAIPRSIGYAVASIVAAASGAPDTAAEMADSANRLLQPVRNLGRKIRNDLGLLTKAVVSVARISWGLVGGVLLVPATIVLSPISLVSRALEGISELLGADKARAFFKRSDSPRKIFVGVNKAIFTPGIISRALDVMVGVMRYDASGKNLNLATEDMDAIEFNRRILNPITPPKVNDESLSRRITKRATEEVPLHATVLNFMQEELGKHASLKAFAKATSFDDVIGKLYAELSKGRNSTKFYDPSRDNENFRRELKLALFAVNEKINQLDNVNFEDRKSYQDQIMDLLYLRKRDPLTEFKDIYSKFAAFEFANPVNSELPESLQEQLNESYHRLIAAQDALKSLETSYDPKLPRPQAVVNFLQQHDCLTIQVVRDMNRLKKLIANNQPELKATRTLQSAENMLQAYGMAHKAARVTSHRLAIYTPIRKILTQLHAVKPQTPVKKIKPIVLPTSSKANKTSKARKDTQEWPSAQVDPKILSFLSDMKDQERNTKPVKKKTREIILPEPNSSNHALSDYKNGSLSAKPKATAGMSSPKNESKANMMTTTDDTETKRRNK